MIFKGGTILISLILVPMTLSYLNPYEYGIWLTLSSTLAWIYTFDIGLGNGLRNKLTEALALNDLKLARIYVSTSFVIDISYRYLFIVYISTILVELGTNIKCQCSKSTKSQLYSSYCLYFLLCQFCIKTYR